MDHHQHHCLACIHLSCKLVNEIIVNSGENPGLVVHNCNHDALISIREHCVPKMETQIRRVCIQRIRERPANFHRATLLHVRLRGPSHRCSAERG